jgi:hypothetical protein
MSSLLAALWLVTECFSALPAPVCARLWHRCLHVESGFDPEAVNPRSGACGIGGVIPRWSRYSCEQQRDPRTSARAAVEAAAEWHGMAGECWEVGYSGRGWGKVRECRQRGGDHE